MDFKLSCKILNNYINNEQNLQNEINELLSDDKLLNDKNVSEISSDLIEEFKNFLRFVYEKILLEFKKNNLHITIQYLENSVIKDGVLILDVSNQKKFFYLLIYFLKLKKARTKNKWKN